MGGVVWGAWVLPVGGFMAVDPGTGRVEHEVDEKWMPEWVAWGVLRFESYLGKHARFEAWLALREETRDDGSEG